MRFRSRTKYGLLYKRPITERNPHYDIIQLLKKKTSVFSGILQLIVLLEINHKKAQNRSVDVYGFTKS